MNLIHSRFFIYSFIVFVLFPGMYCFPAGTSSQTAASNTVHSHSGEQWYSNGNIISEIPLRELESNQVYVIPDKQIISEVYPNPDYKAVVHALLAQTNIHVIHEMMSALRIHIPDQDMKAEQKLSVIYNALARKGEKSIFTKESLIERHYYGSIVLQSGDLLESLIITRDTKEERMINITGKVVILSGNYRISADYIRMNTATRYIYAQGNLKYETGTMKIHGEKLLIDVNKQNGFIFNVSGTIDNMYYTGALLKINNPDYFTVVQGTATVDTNQPPHFHLNALGFDFYHDDTVMMNNMMFYVHNHPFFYFPFLIQKPFGTGLTSEIGHTIREGYYILNSYSFTPPLIGAVQMQFNLFQNTGQYIRLENINTIGRHTYDARAAFARYYENDLIPAEWYKDEISKSTAYHTKYPGDEMIKSADYLYKIDYEHSVEIINPTNSLGVRNVLTGSFHHVSDPAFSSKAERDTAKYNALGLTTEEITEPFFIPVASDNNRYGFNYSLNTMQSAFSIIGNWDYAIEQNPDPFIQPDDDNYFLEYPRNIIFPNFQFTHHGVIGPSAIAAPVPGRGRNLNIDYSAGLDYTMREIYYHQPPYDFERNQNTLLGSASIGRSFTLNRYNNDRPFAAADLTIVPSLIAQYRKQWGGEDLGETYTADNLRNTYVSFQNTENIIINFPSASTKNKWAAALDKRAMLPVAEINLNYSVTFRDDYTDQIYEFKGIENIIDHHISASGTIRQNGYGLFYIPYLDFVNTLGLGSSYDLKPFYDEAQEKKEFTWTQERMNTASGYYDFSLTYRGYINGLNTLQYYLYDSSITPPKNEFTLQQNKLGLSFIIPGSVRDRGVRLQRITTSFGWVYNFQQEQYLSDMMNFAVESDIILFKYFNLKFSMHSANTRAYRYVKSKADYMNTPHLYFHEDIFYSTGLAGQKKQSESQFKINMFAASLIHDLDSWLLTIDYSIRPVALDRTRTFSLKGYYFEQKIMLNINLKPEIKIGTFDKKFPPLINEDLTPEEFKRY